MRKSSRDFRARRRFRRSPPGASPGYINIAEDAQKLRVFATVFSPEDIKEQELFSIDEVRNLYKGGKDRIFWFDVQGFGNKEFLEQLADLFSIHRLHLEDVVNVYQRPKAEELSSHLFFVSRILRLKQAGFSNDQLALFLGKNYVITFVEKYEDIFEPVKARIRHGKGYLRKSGADYLAYSIMDIVIDNYYPIIERMGDTLDDLQFELISNPNRDSLNRLLLAKSELVSLRRIVWSERDKINDIIRSDFDQIDDATITFFRDTYDHCIQLLDLVESSKEVTASLMDVYQSSVGNKLNQVMKVLTIISTIFIPLTFIVGIYGMNFQRINPKTGEAMPLSMPELYSPYGYLVVCLVMVIIVIAQVILFYRKGWLTREGHE